MVELKLLVYLLSHKPMVEHEDELDEKNIEVWTTKNG